MGRGSTDRTLRIERGVATRLLTVDCAPVLVRAWARPAGQVAFRAEAVDPEALTVPVPGEELRAAIRLLPFPPGIDEDMAAFPRRFRRDPLVGPLLRRLPGYRPRRR